MENIVSLARARISMARPIMIRRQVVSTVLDEVRKGSMKTPAPVPVVLEPPYWALRCSDDLQQVGNQSAFTPAQFHQPDDRVRLRVWIPSTQDTQWTLCETFPRQLQGVRHRLGFEIAGNQERLGILLSCHRDDLRIVQTAFQGTFSQCILTPLSLHPFSHITEAQWESTHFYDFRAPTIYSKPLTPPEQTGISPLNGVLAAIRQVPAHALALYQVLFQPVAAEHNWHRNIAALYDQEFFSRFLSNQYPLLRSTQQTPSADEKVLAESLAAKAHNDKSIFAIALRLAIIGAGTQATEFLRSLDAFSGLIQHGGRPWERLTEADYPSLCAQGIADLFVQELTYRPGFLANSAELTSFVHLPSQPVLDNHTTAFPLLEHLVPSEDLSQGSYIGDCHFAGRAVPICVPLEDRPNSVHIIGKPGKGKTELLKRLIVDDILRNDGVVVLDPHGDLIEDLLELVPPEHSNRVIYLDWSDPDWVPIFNPLSSATPATQGILADNIVSAFKGLSEGWGHRAEHILRSLLHGLLHLPEISLLDASDILSTSDPTSKALCLRIGQAVDDPLLKRFFCTDLYKYTAADRSPVQHKLGLLLDVPPVSRTFMQTASSINLRQAMEEKKVILVNLGGLGSDSQGTLGSLILSLLQIETLSRNQQSRGRRRPFHIHIDEAHRFQTDALDAILMQCRKYRISVCLCHQYLRQYSATQVDALATVGSTIIFNVDTNDAQRLSHSLQEKVALNDIIAMKRFQAIARIDTEIVRVHTRQVPLPSHTSCRQAIIERSRQLYYKPLPVVLDQIRCRGRRWDQPSASPMLPITGVASAEFLYDEF